MYLIERAVTRIVAVLLASLVVTACGQQAQKPEPVAAASAPAAAENSFTHLILTVPEGSGVPTELLDTTTGGEKTVPATPWVRSVKRDAPSGFAALSSLGFSDRAALDAWSREHAASLTAPLAVKRARILASSESRATGAVAAMFKISYYSLVAPVSEFEQWVEGYLSKYLAAQRDGGILASYAMYLEEGEQGRALLVLEYPNASTEQSAEPVKAKLSEQLAANDSEYAAQMVKKEELRTTQSWTLAVPVASDGG